MLTPYSNHHHRRHRYTAITTPSPPPPLLPPPPSQEHFVSGLLCTEVPIALSVKIDGGGSGGGGGGGDSGGGGGDSGGGGGGVRERLDVTVIEASRASQDTIVDSALALEGDDTTTMADRVALGSGDPYGAVLWPAGAAVADMELAPGPDSAGARGRHRAAVPIRRNGWLRPRHYDRLRAADARPVGVRCGAPQRGRATARG